VSKNCRIAFVTGSVTGIGKAIAARLIADGWSVVIHGPHAEEARTASTRLGAVGWTAGDLGDPQVPARLIADVIATCGRLDGLVNNAASLERSNIETTDCASFDRILAINSRAPLLLIQAALPYLRSSGSSAVLNIGSINAYCGERNLLAYSMSKGALTTLTRSLSDALGVERIRINQINPGWTLTENEYALKMREGLPEDWPRRLSRNDAPYGRLIAPEEIAEIAALLLSDKVGPISGTVLDAEQFPMIGRNPFRGVG
jgi:NAD(P)-dependent dehydrogenase (short-subunit alcohol dehydrogenase family)